MFQRHEDRRLIAKSEVVGCFGRGPGPDCIWIIASHNPVNKTGKPIMKEKPLEFIGNLTKNVACRVPVLRHGQKRDADCNWLG